MSWHIASYTGSIAGTANTDLPADTSEGVLTILNGHFVLRERMSLLGAMAIGALLLRARFDSPSMRLYGNPFIRPVIGTALPANDDAFDLAHNRPFQLPVGEELAVQVSNSGAGPTRTSAFVALGKTLESLPGGQIYKVRFTSTTTMVANAWSQAAFTLDTGLPSGQYAMVGSEVFGTTNIFHRWFFFNQIPRPGFPSLATENLRLNQEFYSFPWGTLGHFINTAPPILQCFCGAADTALSGYMYLIPEGNTTQLSSPATQPMMGSMYGG